HICRIAPVPEKPDTVSDPERGGLLLERGPKGPFSCYDDERTRLERRGDPEQQIEALLGFQAADRAEHRRIGCDTETLAHRLADARSPREHHGIDTVMNSADLLGSGASREQLLPHRLRHGDDDRIPAQ